MQGRIFLSGLTLRNILTNLSKGWHGEGGLYYLVGNREIKEKTGFRKSRITGYQFKAPKKENRWLETKINSDQAPLYALNKGFSTGKGRPLPYVDTNGVIKLLGGFDIFHVDQQEEKFADTDF